MSSTSNAGESRSSGTLLTLERGIRVIEHIAAQDGRATAKSTSAATGVNPGTCYQLIRTFEAHGYVTRRPGGLLALGPALGRLSDRYLEQAEPPPAVFDGLQRLHDAIEETVYVSLIRRDTIPLVALREGTRAIRVGNLEVGYAGAPHARASCQAAIAYLPRSERTRFVDPDGLEALTERTITDWSRFEERLDTVRARGYAIECEEFTEGVACLGAVIIDRDHTVLGAFGTSFAIGTTARTPDEMAQIMMRVGADTSRALGYDGPYPPA